MIRGTERDLNIARHHLEALARPNVLLRLEVDDFAAELHRQQRRIEQRKPAYTAALGMERFLESIDADTDGAHDSESGNDDFLTRGHYEDSSGVKTGDGGRNIHCNLQPPALPLPSKQASRRVAGNGRS